MKAIVMLMFAARLVAAQTNDVHFDVLRTLDGQNFTNATIIRTTPAYAVVDFSAGGANVYFTNLPVELRNLYHYDPVAAEQFLAAKAAKKRLEPTPRDRANASVAVAKQSLGVPVHVKLVRLNPDGFIVIRAEGPQADPHAVEAVIHNLPPNILPLLREFSEAVNDVDRTAPTGESIRRSNKADKNFHKWSTIIARPSEYYPRPGVRQWEFVEMGDPNWLW